MSDKPYRLPPALTVANLCAQRAWDHEIDDESRLRLEMAADTIRAMHRRMMLLAKSNEVAEATNEQLAGFIQVLSGQKGGAA